MEAMQCELEIFADDTKIHSIIETIHDIVKLQQDLNKMQDWSAPNMLKILPIILSWISQKMLLIILFLFSYLTDYSSIIPIKNLMFFSNIASIGSRLNPPKMTQWI